MRLDPFIEAEEAAGHSIKRCCDLFQVSRAAYYVRRKAVPSPREISDAALTEKIREIFNESKGTYGSPRVHHELRARGEHVGRRRVARLMRIAGLEGRCLRRWRRTTIPDPDEAGRAMDLIQRAFGPCEVLDARYVGDITYIPTWEGWAFLATVIDLASRRVVGWAVADHMRTELVAEALRKAHAARTPAPGLIFHADKGSQYTSGDYARLARDLGVVLSFSSTGDCFDNAVAESFFATIKRELLDRQAWPNAEAVRSAVFNYVEGWYNTRRLHSSLGYLSPADYEAAIRNKEVELAA